MGIKITDMTPDTNVGGGELIPVSDAGSPKSVTTAAIKDFTIDQIEALAAGVSVSGSDGVYVLQSGVLKPVNIDLVAQRAIDTVWGKAAITVPGGTDVLPAKAGGTTEKTITLTVLAEFVRSTIEAAILDVSDLSAAGALSGTDVFLVTQGTTGKKVTLTAVYNAIYAGLQSYIEGLTEATALDSSDVFLTISGGVPKMVLLSTIMSNMGDCIAPASTTENKIPQWASGQKTLKDGLTLQTAVRASGTAADSSVPTEKAVRDLHAAALTNKLTIIDGGVSTLLTAAQTGALVLLNSNDVVTLPAATGSSGVFFDFIAQTVATQAPRIEPNASEVINLQGTDLTGGKYADAAAIGDTLRLVCDGAKWWTVHGSGTWTHEA